MVSFIALALIIMQEARLTRLNSDNGLSRTKVILTVKDFFVMLGQKMKRLVASGSMAATFLYSCDQMYQIFLSFANLPSFLPPILEE